MLVRRRTLVNVALAALTALAACTSAPSGAPPGSAPAPAGRCRSGADCGSGACEAAPAPASARPIRKIVAPCMNTCAVDSECGAGSVCDFSAAGGGCMGQCIGACTEASCSDGYQCAENGHCEAFPCTDPSFAGCPDGWACDEAAAASPSASGGLSTTGAISQTLSSAPYLSGCRPLPCDDPEGAVCIPGWACDLTLAKEGSVGCYPLPCDELGRCSNDVEYICEPTSANTRFANVDEHGCVTKNCEEGYPCRNGEVCDFSRANANMAGCGVVMCDEPGAECATERNVCDPSYQWADESGCRFENCMEGFECLSTATCDPTNEAADLRGCVTPTINDPASTDPLPTDPLPTDPRPTDPTNDPDGAAGAAGASQMQAPPVSSGGATSTGTGGSATPPMREGGAAEGAACSVDGDCAQGYCVLGACRPQLGVCGG